MTQNLSREAPPGASAASDTTVSFITWLPHCRRSDGIAAALGGPSHLVHYLGYKRPAQAPLKYLLASVTTLRRLWRERPSLVLVATPPVPAAVVVWAYCVLTSSSFVIDAHTGSFDDQRWRWALPLQRWLARRADATVVTGPHLASQVESWGARALVIGTVPVTFPPADPADLGPGQHVVVVNTFSRDEPIDAILAAAAATPDVTFHVTGNTARAGTAVAEAPRNVRFTGWLTDEDYHGLLRASDVVMCLTTRDHTMQRGGYEAMAVGRPLVTSDWPLLRSTFSHGTLHVDNTPAAIAAAVTEALVERQRLAEEMSDLATRRAAEFAVGVERLVSISGGSR